MIQQALLGFIPFILFILVSGCTPPINSTLLSERKTCTDDACTNDQTSTTGSLSIAPDSDSVSAFVETTDLVEVSGVCNDLGRKKNQILVQLFEGEDEAAQPIMDNSISTKCQDNISTTSLQGGGSDCLFVTQGIGIADAGQPTSQYPQCFNGRFSFKVRIGKIIRRDGFINDKIEATNPKLNYMVRMKLRTTDGVTQDSAFSKIRIGRFVSKPIFSLPASLEDASAHRCRIKLDGAKFKDVRYTLKATWVGPTSGKSAFGCQSNSVSETVYVDQSPTFPPLGDGTTLEDFWHFGGQSGVFNSCGLPLSVSGGLMPGITYKYKLEALDHEYESDYNVQFPGEVETSGETSEGTCVQPPPNIQTRTLDPTPRTCSFELSGFNIGSPTSPNIPYSIEWRYSDTSANWPSTSPNSGFLVDPNSGCRDQSICTVTIGPNAATSGTPVVSGPPLVAGKTFFFAARQYIDMDGDKEVDPGEFVGEWTTTVVNSDGSFQNSCGFAPL